MLIPPEIVNMPLGDAYKFYRDELKWQVYPCFPRTFPVGKLCKHPGKQPAVGAWWKYDPHDCDVASVFQSANPFNIGVAPRNGLVFVDLDSKHDQGASVRAFLEEHAAKLNGTPRHLSGGGAHLPFLITDLPSWKNPRNGKPFYDVLETQINADVKAELYYCDHNNLVLPPSVHPSGFVYSWDLFGEIRGCLLKWLFDLFGFEEPKASKERKKKKDAPWHLQFRGDLASLDLISLLGELGVHAELQDADDQRYIISCPWISEHSTQGDPDARIWQAADRRPGFKCHHAHCGLRSIKDVLEWAETKTPGIVDRFCSRLRVWEQGQVSATGKVRVLHAIGRLESEVYAEVGKAIGPNHAWFVRANMVNVITQIPSGFTYSDDPNTDFTVEAHTIGFSELDGIQAKGALEKYVEPGILVKEAGADDDEEPEFRPKSFTTDFCSGMIQSDQLKDQLPFIARLLTVPLSFQIRNRLVYPKTGYDPRFGTYLVPGAPEIQPMSLEKALKVIAKLHAGFCFTNDQSRTHAIARLLTPFGRAMIGWTARVPLWFYTANRPRAGKDYLAAIPILVYEGTAFEDLPIGKESEETGKRIMSAARNGRRFMHFSNCQVYLQDQYLIQAITNPVINGRRLGSNDATSDLSVPNEMEFSISANVGLVYREDLGPRMRKIELAYFEEDPNSRTFADPFLHQTIKDNRSLVLSAISALYDNWCAKGFPKGKTRFTSFPKWAEIIGGVMMAAGLGDPCLPFQGRYDDNGGDNKTSSMLELFKVCHLAFKEEAVKKPQLYQCIQNEAADNELLSWFGQLEELIEKDADRIQIQKNRSRLGRLLLEFEGRVLGGIRLEIEKSSGHPSRYTYQFLKLREDLGINPAETAKIASKPEKSCHPVTPCHLFSGSFGCAREIQILDNERRVCNTPVIGGDPLEGDNGDKVTTPVRSNFLALDLETSAEVKVSRRAKAPKITVSGDALRPWRGEIRLVSLADEDGNIQLFDLHTKPLPAEILGALTRQPLIIHNAAFDMLFLGVLLGIQPKEVFCTLTASRLLTPSRKVSHSLGAVLERHLGIRLPKEHGGTDWGSFVITDDQLDYARNDVRYLHQLKDVLEAEIEKAGLTRVFKLESDLIPVVVDIERRGFAVDTEKMRGMLATTEARQSELRGVLRTKFGIPKLNPDSPTQIAEAFESIGAQVASTNEEALTALDHELVPVVLEYRGAAKLAGSITGLLKHVHADGRIHAQFKPLGSDPGRFSSSKPNLQNVDRGELRSCFVPSENHKLIVADYSQIKLRIGAIFANDTVMLDAFRAGEDLHRKTAAGILSKQVEEVVKADRQLAKAVNFGFLYGQGPEGFQRYAKTTYGIALTLEEATEFRRKFFEQYPGLLRWHQAAWNKVEAITEARTILGRILLPRGDTDWAKFQMLTNYITQGSAADVIKVAMTKLTYRLPSGLMVATVHDELVFDVPTEGAESLCELIRMTMVDAFTEVFGDIIPMEVEAKVCSSWAEK